MQKNVIFFGSHEVSVPLLKFIQTINYINISGIITQPDKPTGRGCQLRPTKIADFAVINNIPLLKPEKPDVETSNWINRQGCDVIFVMAYGHILRANILELATYGIYNFHGSILPKYRGASPIETALCNGEKETGVTLMEVVPAMDAGDIIDIEKFKINDEDTSIDVYKKIANSCVILVERNLYKIFNKTITKTKQDQSFVSFTRKLTKEDMKLDFANETAINLINRTRAMAIRGNCFFEYHGETFKVGMCAVNNQNLLSDVDYVINTSNSSIIFKTKDKNFEVFEIQKLGSKMLKVSDFLNGNNLFC